MPDEFHAHVTRIVDRLRRDHPDPAMRHKLYANGLHDYVRILLNDVDDAESLVDRIATAVRDAEDNQPGPSTLA